MNKETIVTGVRYFDSEQEILLDEFTKRVVAQTELEGKHDGGQMKPRTYQDWQALNINLVEIAIQGMINKNQQRHLLASGIAVVNRIKTEAEQKIFDLRNQIHELSVTLSVAIEAAKKLKPSERFVQIRNWIMAGLIATSCMEGGMSYPAFRHFPFPIIPSMMAAVAIALGVALSTHHFSPFIKAATTVRQWVFRYLLCLLPAILVFSVVGYLRAAAYAHKSGFAVDGGHSAGTSSHASGVALASISIALYAIGLAVSARFARTKAEVAQEHAYKDKCVEVDALRRDIKDREEDIFQIEKDQDAHILVAMQRYEYAHHHERLLVNLADHLCEVYKQKNQRHRTDDIPAFFSEKPKFKFTLYFNNVKTPQHEID